MSKKITEFFPVQIFPTEFVRIFEKVIWEHWPELKQIWMLHDNDVRPHRAYLVDDYLTSRDIQRLSHPPYGLYFAPCDFWLFPLLERAIMAWGLRRMLKTGLLFRRSSGNSFGVSSLIINSYRHIKSTYKTVQLPGFVPGDGLGEIHVIHSPYIGKYRVSKVIRNWRASFRKVLWQFLVNLG